MVLIKIDTDKRLVYLECDNDDSAKIFYLISGYSKHECTDKCVIFTVDLNNIDTLNRDLLNFDGKIELDNSFINWKESRINNHSTKSPVLIRAGVVNSKIYKGSFTLPVKEIEDACKYFFQPAVRQKKFKEGKWDGYICLYKRWLNSFPTGLIDKVCEVLKNHDLPYRVEYCYDRNPPKEFNWSAKKLFELEPDQVEAINACIDGGRGVCKAPTGFGKTSALARYLTALHGVPTLFIANKKVLLDDAAKDFGNGIEGITIDDIAQIKDGWFGETKLSSTTTIDDVNPITQPIMVATIQSLSARLKDERTRPHLLDWLKNVCKFVMVDETQAVGTQIWDDVLNEIGAPYRICLSATPRRTDGATLKIHAVSGPLLFDTSAEVQIIKGRLCELDIQYHPFDHKIYNDNDSDLNYSEVYSSFIVNNESRNRFIIERTLDLLEEERFVLILVQAIEHGHILKEMLLQSNLGPDDVKFIWGDTPNKIRNEVIENFRQGKLRVMIGSTIADAGLDIKLVSGVILAGAGNSDITLIQRIGRGARNCDYESILGYTPKFISDNDGKKVTTVIDILDVNIAFFKKQAKNRYYNAREEFGVDRVHIVGADSSIFRYRSKKQEDIKDISDSFAQLEMIKQFEDSKDNNEEYKNAKTNNGNKKIDDFINLFRS